jgi:hypothetical protein
MKGYCQEIQNVFSGYLPYSSSYEEVCIMHCDTTTTIKEYEARVSKISLQFRAA